MRYQSTQLRLLVDGLDMTHLSSFSSSNPLVAEVGSDTGKVVGRSAGTVVVSAFGGVASVTITVEADTVMHPQLANACENMQVVVSGDVSLDACVADGLQSLTRLVVDQCWGE